MTARVRRQVLGEDDRVLGIGSGALDTRGVGQAMSNEVDPKRVAALG